MWCSHWCWAPHTRVRVSPPPRDALASGTPRGSKCILRSQGNSCHSQSSAVPDASPKPVRPPPTPTQPAPGSAPHESHAGPKEGPCEAKARFRVPAQPARSLPFPQPAAAFPHPSGAEAQGPHPVSSTLHTTHSSRPRPFPAKHPPSSQHSPCEQPPTPRPPSHFLLKPDPSPGNLHRPRPSLPWLRTQQLLAPNSPPGQRTESQLLFHTPASGGRGGDLCLPG